MRNTRRKQSGLLIITAILVTGGVYFGVSAWKDSTGQDALAARPAESLALPYATVQPSRVTLTTELPGRVSAFMVSEVRPQVSGIITERLFVEGSDVREGQVLYQIDPALYEAACQNAEAALAKARANEKVARLLSERHGRLVKTNAVSKQGHDDAVAGHLQALADVDAAGQALETARINLGYTRIKAPVSGRIGRSKVTQGALATQHQAAPLAVIQQLDQVYVDVTHPSSELLRLRRALAKGELQSGGSETYRAKLRLEDGSMYGRLPGVADDGAHGPEIEGRLLFSDVTIEKSTGAVSIRALFENPDKILLPGMYVRAVVEEGNRDDAVLVAQKLVMRDNRDRPYVYVLTREIPKNAAGQGALAADEYYVAMRLVQIDRHYDNAWLLSGGLDPGDRLLIEGLIKVHPGMRVRGLDASPQSFSDTTQAR